MHHIFTITWGADNFTIGWGLVVLLVVLVVLWTRRNY